MITMEQAEQILAYLREVNAALVTIGASVQRVADGVASELEAQEPTEPHAVRTPETEQS